MTNIENIENIEIWYIPGHIHQIVPVSVEPVTVMTQWKLVQITANDGRRFRHLVGRADYEGRVCSAIVSIDLAAMCMTTKSGRVYELEGPPGHDTDADWVFSHWLRRKSIPVFRDMTWALLRLRRRREGAIG